MKRSKTYSRGKISELLKLHGKNNMQNIEGKMQHCLVPASQMRIYCFSALYIIVQLYLCIFVKQSKTFEDTTLGSGKLRWAFFSQFF